MLTALCVIVSLASPFIAFWIDATSFFPYIRRYPDGSSIGFYARGSAHILVRRILFPAGMDGEEFYDPLFLAFFCVPPLLWFNAFGRGHQPKPFTRLFVRGCATCPLAAAMMISYTRNTEIELLVIGIFALIVYSLIRITRIFIDRPSLAVRRLRIGLCPHCAYDIRATPEPNGSILSRCPECGLTLNSQPASQSNSN